MTARQSLNLILIITVAIRHKCKCIKCKCKLPPENMIVSPLFLFQVVLTKTMVINVVYPTINNQKPEIMSDLFTDKITKFFNLAPLITKGCAGVGGNFQISTLIKFNSLFFRILIGTILDISVCLIETVETVFGYLKNDV